MKKAVAIIIPSYNEVENFKILLNIIFKEVPKGTIYIVDDSPEEEKLKLKRLIAEKKGAVNLISRNEKDGRGSAVILGLKEAFADKNILYFIEMDADMSHDPHEINKLIQASSKADVIIGSRYRNKSRIVNWPMRRLILSRIVNLFLNILLGVKLTDYTNGFRLYNRDVVNFLISARLKEKGFIALSEIAYKLHKTGFTFSEVPITFTDRKNGKSSADIREHCRSLYGAIRIRLG